MIPEFVFEVSLIAKMGIEITHYLDYSFGRTVPFIPVLNCFNVINHFLDIPPIFR